MKTRWLELRSKHWNNRPAQERRVIAVTFLLLLPIVFYYLLWQPAHHAVDQLHSALPILQAQSIKMQEQSSEADALRHRPEIAELDAASLKSSIADSASRHQLNTSITSLDMQEPAGVRITCDAVSFAAWINWLHVLEQEQHIRVAAISISPLPQPGLVKINATLTNGNSL